MNTEMNTQPALGLAGMRTQVGLLRGNPRPEEESKLVRKEGRQIRWVGMQFQLSKIMQRLRKEEEKEDLLKVQAEA